MSEPILSVAFFRTDAGNEPVRAFLRDLTVEDRKAIGADIKTVQFGWPLGMPPPTISKPRWSACANSEGTP